MALFGTNEFNNLNDLFINQLQDLYDAEIRLTKALPKMAEAARTPELKQAFERHEKVTEEHARRLEDIFKKMNCAPERETSLAMIGLINDGREMINARGDDAARDAALIAAAQRVEHYEIAGYGCARTYAQELGMRDVADTLQKTLNEEGEADKGLSQIAESRINVQAVH